MQLHATTGCGRQWLTAEHSLHIAVLASKAEHTVTASLSQPPVPSFPSICTLTGTGGVHSTLRYCMSIRPFSIGAICKVQGFLGLQDLLTTAWSVTLLCTVYSMQRSSTTK